MSGVTGPVLRVEALGVSYGALVALDDVTWSVREGEILGIIGPNGAGKSSCYDAVTHLVRRRGQVFLNGEEVTDIAPHLLAERGLKRAFQQNAFFHEMTVLENMITVLQDRYGTGLVATTLLPFAEARRRRDAVEDARQRLMRFGIPEAYHGLKPTNIPYGTQRMLSIALAYGSGAKALLLDEPAAGLGGKDMTHLIDLLISLKQERLALVVIEHHMDLIMSVADKIVVLEQGRLLATGTPQQIQSDPRVLEAYLGRAQ
ncbi:ABC transporter ATP-binding protein [Microvirga splendida]|uniref:ATP-binding cassette domain-containing protein n=1 Tax=Microvirga splendida TaxID=2795727 RepID=A0ABS0Y732_9HYPH|nr:ATP-binding cassette domain-containing protein [Microvirga splendida]MBJ6128101.1 ATP-binding cassette domain-containing protein [Microvirga splendida]